MRAWWCLLLLLPLASAQPLVVLEHHPYPDSADPLGIPFADTGVDAMRTWHQRHAENGSFAYPFVVVDGVLAFAGIPDSKAPFLSTLQAYESAIRERGTIESPITLQLGVEGNTASLDVNAAFEDPTWELRMALVEDHVLFTPPSGLSNGVSDHRFVVRELFTQPFEDTWRVDLTIPSDAPRDQLYVAAWVVATQGFDARFEAGEVLQATLHPLRQQEPTIQTERAVLFEMRTATWCDPCLFGDLAADDLFERYGVVETIAVEPAVAGYWIPAQQPLFVLLALVGTAAALALWRPRS